MRKSTWILLSAVIVVGVVTGVEVQRGVTAAKHLTPVVVAVQNVPPYAKLTRQDVKIEERSLTNLSQKPEVQMSQVIGRYASVGLVPGAMVFPDTLSNLSPLLNLPVTERDVTIPLNRTDFGVKDLRPGMHVDLVGVTQGTANGATGGMIAADVEIIQVTADNSNSPDRMTVAVPVNQATAATHAALNGNVRVDIVPEG